MDARDLLSFAEHLVVSRNAGPAHFRTAIGRAYYSAFHLASETLGGLGFPPAESAQGQSQVVRLLQRCGDEELAATGGLLGDLHGLRLKADYELRRSDVEKSSSARNAVEIAQSMRDDLAAFLADQPRQLAVNATLKPLYRGITGKTG